jgi:hypothetical protein
MANIVEQYGRILCLDSSGSDSSELQIFFDGFFESLEGIEVTHGLPLSITRASKA